MMSFDRGSVLGWLYRFAASDFLPQATAILILLAGGMLVYRSLRERYFLLWIQGWAVYLVYKFSVANAMFAGPGQFPWSMVADLAFVLAITFFAASVLFYVDNRKLLLPLAGSAIVALEAAVVRVLWLPDSDALLRVLFGIQVAISATAGMQLVIHCRGRRAAGPFLFAGSLILLPLSQRVTGLSTLVELLLGLGMVIFVLEETRLRTNRLRVVHDITSSIAEAHDFGSIMSSVLEELKTHVFARAAWFRLLEGEELVLYQYSGLPQEFLKSRHAIALEGSLTQQAIQKGEPRVVRVAEMDREQARALRSLRLHHLILIPVFGKNSVVGAVSLGCVRSRRYTAGELEFLRTASRQLGIAVENLRMFEQVMRTQRQWANTFDSIEDAILVHDEAFQVIKGNRALVDRLGLKPESIVNQSCEQVLPGTRKDWSGCPYCSREVGQYREMPDPSFGGFSMVSTSSYAEEGSGRRGTIHIIRDITHQRSAEEKYRLLFQQAQEGVYISTPDGQLMDCNEAFARMLGYSSREEILKLDVGRDLYASPDQREAFCREMAADNFVRNYEVTLRKKDGGRVTVLETSFASRDTTGNVDCFQGFMLDISEKKRAEEEIRRRNRELFALNTIAVTATQSLDLDEVLNVTIKQVMDLFAADTGAVYLVDEEALSLRRRVGAGHQSELGVNLTDVPIPKDFWETISRSRTQVITHQHLQHLPAFVTEFVEAEGLKSWLWVTLWSKDRIVGLLAISTRSPREFSATDENLMIAIGRQLATTIEKIRLYDETTRAYEDLRHTQEQLLQSEKMSAVGQLISGVAHELNNPLTAILGYAQLLENEDLSTRVRDFVQKLYKQAQRTHRIVQNLLSFARQRKPQKQHVDLCKVLEDTMALREYDLRLHNIAVEQEFETPLPGVIADGHQLEQVFLNIINNAVDAIQEKTKAGSIKTRVFVEEDSVCAEVQDSGPGIRDPKRVFDPFYTTKAVGKGTGLGLSICYGIIKEHGGDIVARNAREGGAIFNIRLPAVRNPVVRTEKRRRVTAREERLQGRILLVDDEEAVLDFVREMLTAASAEVVAAAGGEEAMARLQKESFDAVVLDSTLPGPVSGIDIYEWVQKQRPGVEKSIIMTFSTDVSEGKSRRFIQETGVQRLVKPFEVADLIALLRRVLESAKPVPAGVEGPGPA